MELSEFLLILRVRWKALVLSVLLCAMAAAAFTITRTPVYSADASGFVKTTGMSELSADSYAKSRARSFLRLATSRATAEAVIDELKLDTSPEALVDQITVAVPTGTVLIQITAQSSSPGLARDLANAWVKALSVQVNQIENLDNTDDDGTTTTLLAVESAVTPRTPISPNPERNIAIGLLLGLALGLGYAMLRHHLDKRMRTSDSVEAMFKRPVVGTIPLDDSLTDVDRITLSLSGRMPAGGHDPAIAESFRSLRTNLHFMNVDSPPRIIVVTSPMSGDGKSTVTSNLAVAIAASGSKVVVVDGDLRHPVIAGVFGLPEGAGLTDVLIGRATLEEMLQPWSADGSLQVLGAGTVPPNPNELLSSELMSTLLGRLAKDYIVLVDAPPLLPVSDAAALAARADGVLLVITSGRTTKDALARSLAMLDKVDSTTLGVIMNRMPRKGPLAHQYGYYGSNYAVENYAPDTGAGERRFLGIALSRLNRPESPATTRTPVPTPPAATPATTKKSTPGPAPKPPAGAGTRTAGKRGATTARPVAKAPVTKPAFTKAPVTTPPATKPPVTKQPGGKQPGATEPAATTPARTAAPKPATNGDATGRTAATTRKRSGPNTPKAPTSDTPHDRQGSPNDERPRPDVRHTDVDQMPPT